MRKMNELKGKETIIYVAGASVSDMLTAEPKYCAKIDFASVKSNLVRQGKPYVLVAESGRETIEEAIAAFVAEQARQERQNNFFNEVSELHTIKEQIKDVERIINDPRIQRIKRILKAVNPADKKYTADILINGLTGLTYSEKEYIKENLI